LLLFANGRWIIPLATWLAGVFIIRFLRTQKPVRGLILGLLTNIVVTIIAWRGMIPVPGLFYFLIAAGIGTTFFLPYLADRLIAPRLNGFASTLVFPLAWTTVEYINSLANPYGTWGALAYTQYGNLPLVQIVSVTGVWGLAFLMAWFAAVANWAWERGFAWSRIRRGIGLYVGALVLVLLFGGARLALFPPTSDTVRVAAITSSFDIFSGTAGEALAAGDWESLRPAFATVQNGLLERSRQAVQAGAEIIVWHEGAAPVLKEDEAPFIERGREFARQEQVYLGMALFAFLDGFPNQPGENKLVLIDPSGNVMWEYWKSIPVPGEPSLPGDGLIPTQDTPYGRIAAAICFDMDFPGLIRQAGKAGADLMLVPSNDWPDIDPLHTHMASFRAIENGFSLVRITGNGLSAAFDYQGRVLAAVDYFTSGEQVMVAHVPIQGVKTIYSVIGDLFAWLCVAGSVAFVGWAVVRRKRG
jgi:apolipoprotein N-acyltransferase